MDLFCLSFSMFQNKNSSTETLAHFSPRPGQAEEVWSGMLQDLWRFATEMIEINLLDMGNLPNLPIFFARLFPKKLNCFNLLEFLSSKVSEYKGFSHVSSLWNSQRDGVATIEIELLRKCVNFRGCLSCSARNFLKWRNSAGIQTCSARLVIVGVVGLWAMPNSTCTVWESFYARKDALLADAAIMEIERRYFSKMLGRSELSW